MKRTLVVVVAALTTASCAIVADGGQEAGPEQFRFVMRPGSGLGDEAEELVGGLADGEVVRAEHVTWVETPVGRIDLLDTVEVIDGAENECRLVVAPRMASKACGEGFDEPRATEIRDEGSSSDGEWQLVEVRAGEAVRALRATADDGTVYEATVVRGVSLVAYPGHRGAISIQGLGPGGEAVGVPITAGGMGP